jgi:hypothetical protein
MRASHPDPVIIIYMRLYSEFTREVLVHCPRGGVGRSPHIRLLRARMEVRQIQSKRPDKWQPAFSDSGFNVTNRMFLEFEGYIWA